MSASFGNSQQKGFYCFFVRNVSVSKTLFICFPTETDGFTTKVKQSQTGHQRPQANAAELSHVTHPSHEQTNDNRVSYVFSGFVFNS